MRSPLFWEALLGALMVVMGFFGLWLLRAGFHSAARLLRAVKAHRHGFRGLAAGKVALRGRVVTIDALCSPETGRQGVYLSYTADRWQRTAAMGGLSGHWIRAEADEEAAPFELTDGEASVLVDPRCARVLAGQLVEEVQQPDGSVVCYREVMIQEGEEVLVIGQADHHGGFGPSCAYRGHSFRTVISAPHDDRLLIGAPGLVTRTVALSALVRIAGSAAALLGFFGLLALLH